MAKRLKELLLEGIQAWARVAQERNLLLRRPMLDHAMDFIEGDPDAKYAATELRKLFCDPNWAGDAAVIERVFQLVGEAQFWMLARAKGVELERISETSSRTPDFRFATSNVKAPCFEVKTLSVVGGTESLKRSHDETFEGEVELRRQLAQGVRVGSTVQFYSPYGDVPDNQEQLVMCESLLKKVENNIKEEQYTSALTFLVVNLSLIDSYYTENTELKPLSTGWPRPTSEHTGVLWTVAFGQLGQEIRGLAREEGEINVQGTLDRLGILVNPQFESVAGMLFIIHPWRKESRLYGVWKSERFADWTHAQPELCDALYKLVGTDWNDEINSNAANLNEMPS